MCDFDQSIPSDSRQEETTTRSHFLRLREIAAWQLDSPVQLHPSLESSQRDKPAVYAELPALQRGAVWNAAQTEALWDSIVRGFPIGSFFLLPYQDGFGKGKYKLGTVSNHDPDYLLLDGQQRATAIALGFLDLWAEPQKYPDGPALWVDLQPSLDSERAFVFRLLTRSHPWGYDRENPRKRLAQSDIRAALEAFKPKSDSVTSAAKIPLCEAWPWDAVCPMPVAQIIACVGASNGDWRTELSKRLAKLPMAMRLPGREAKLKDDGLLIDRWQAAIEGSEEERYGMQLSRIMKALSAELSIGRIPALVLPRDDVKEDSKEADLYSRKDAVETLFVRVNSAGTPLAGEELIYSSLKAAWPDAPEILGALQPDKQRQIVTPARLVGMLWRLHLAFPDNSVSSPRPSKLPPSPSVGDFRKSIRIGNKRQAFRDFVEQPSHKELMVELLQWVRLDDKLTCDQSVALSNSRRKSLTEDWRLPPTLAAQLFAGDRGIDILFVVVAWIKALHQCGRTLTQLSALQRRRSLGFVVAINWFADSPSDCIYELWSQLCNCTDLDNFFNAERFQSLLSPREDGKVIMLPLVPPDVLKKLIEHRVTHAGSTFPDRDQPFWKPGSIWSHFTGQLAPEFTQLDPVLLSWFGELVEADLQAAESETTRTVDLDSISVERRSELRQAWYRLLDKLWNQRSLVDYAQRKWLARWFPDFDPTLPGQMEDINRPWDYDHIHPSSHVVRGVPSVIREWHQSIGNLRAWPLELNRGDQDDSPLSKLISIDANSIYFDHDLLDEEKQKVCRQASFIGDDSEWTNWQNSVPDDIVNRQYLLLPDSDVQRHALLNAITHRFCNLYRHWYDNLALGDLKKIALPVGAETREE